MPHECTFKKTQLGNLAVFLGPEVSTPASVPSGCGKLVTPKNLIFFLHNGFLQIWIIMSSMLKLGQFVV